MTTNKRIISKQSKKFSTGSFLYWWDITPKLIKSLSSDTVVEFIKKECKESCFIPFHFIRNFLTENRQTSRGNGNWGLKVLPKKPDWIAIEEPNKKSSKWITIPVIWYKKY